MNDTLVGHNHAKTPLDVACWDLFGKSVGLPVCELLGGSTGIPMPMISSIYAGDPEDMRRRVAEHRARGYRGHSIKIGALDSEGGPALDAERIAASLADKQPGEFFLVDANGGLLPETALRTLAMLLQGLDFVLEAPCSTWRETLSLRQSPSMKTSSATPSPPGPCKKHPPTPCGAQTAPPASEGNPLRRALSTARTGSRQSPSRPRRRRASTVSA